MMIILERVREREKQRGAMGASFSLTLARGSGQLAGRAPRPKQAIGPINLGDEGAGNDHD